MVVPKVCALSRAVHGHIVRFLQLSRAGHVEVAARLHSFAGLPDSGQMTSTRCCRRETADDARATPISRSLRHVFVRILPCPRDPHSVVSPAPPGTAPPYPDSISRDLPLRAIRTLANPFRPRRPPVVGTFESTRISAPCPLYSPASSPVDESPPARPTTPSPRSIL